jgi:hypothetical protein
MRGIAAGGPWVVLVPSLEDGKREGGIEWPGGGGGVAGSRGLQGLVGPQQDVPLQDEDVKCVPLRGVVGWMAQGEEEGVDEYLNRGEYEMHSRKLIADAYLELLVVVVGQGTDDVFGGEAGLLLCLKLLPPDLLPSPEASCETGSETTHAARSIYAQ